MVNVTQVFHSYLMALVYQPVRLVDIVMVYRAFYVTQLVLAALEELKLNVTLVRTTEPTTSTNKEV